MLLLVLWEAVYVASHEHGHLHGELLLLFKQLRVVILIRGDNDSIGIGIEGKLLACRGACTLTRRLHGLERAISVIVVEEISLVAFVQIFFYVLQAQLTAVLTDCLELGLGEETVDLGYFCDFFKFSQFFQVVSFLSLRLQNRI